MKQIGLTGGIGSGKSTVAKLFELIGIPVFDSDLEARKIMETNTDVVEKIKEMVGSYSYFENGKLNATLVAEKIFTIPEKLTVINALVHPKVRLAYQIWVNQQNSNYVISEAAILIESGRYQDLDALICVNAPESIRIQRVMQRSKLSQSAVMQRIHHQMKEDERAPFCNYTINNNDTQAIIPQVLAIHHQIQND